MNNCQILHVIWLSKFCLFVCLFVCLMFLAVTQIVRHCSDLCCSPFLYPLTPVVRCSDCLATPARLPACSGRMMEADTVLAEGERHGAQPADELAEARRKLQTRVASALAAGQLPAQTVQVGRGAADERQALGALRGA